MQSRQALPKPSSSVMRVVTGNVKIDSKCMRHCSPWQLGISSVLQTCFWIPLPRSQRMYGCVVVCVFDGYWWGYPCNDDVTIYEAHVNTSHAHTTPSHPHLPSTPTSPIHSRISHTPQHLPSTLPSPIHPPTSSARSCLPMKHPSFTP